MRLRLLLPIFVFATACAAPGAEQSADASVDAASDAKKDAATDAPKDALVDTGLFDASDASVDASDVDVVDAGQGQTCNAMISGQCGVGSFCDAVGCGIGTCKLATAESDLLAPVCGCDGVTYWNQTVAENKSATTKAKGECVIGLLCGGSGHLKCPGAIRCNFRQSVAGDCNQSNPNGTCWGLPTNCPPVLIGPTTRQCGAPACADACSLITLGQIYYPDNSCPQ